jgi:carbohydrate-binding DOMON domain-containing protein
MMTTKTPEFALPVFLAVFIVLAAPAVLVTAFPAYGAEILFQASDPAGDDTGDGDYVYPTHEAFGEGGQADLTGCTISRDEGHLMIELAFRDLVDPWQVGNRLTFAAVAIDTAEGGQEMLGHNAGAYLEHPAELQIFLAGDTCQIIDAGWNTLITGARCDADIDNEVMLFFVPLADIGTPTAQWRYTIVAGLQDDYGAGGLGDFRMVEAEAQQWRGGGGIDELDIDPNIYDLILPASSIDSLESWEEKLAAQKKILGSYSLEEGRYVSLPSAN